MAQARAIVKRRKAVRNIRKITKTMQMIATAKFQKALKRAVGTKPYTRKVRELVKELAANVGTVQHPLLRRPEGIDRSGRIAVIVLTSNRGLAGAYNGTIIRLSEKFIREQELAGKTVDLYAAGKKGAAYYTFRHRAIAGRFDQYADLPKFVDLQAVAEKFMKQFVDRQIDALHVVYMNFLSSSQQKPEVLELLPLAQVDTPATTAAASPVGPAAKVTYDFSPDARTLLDDLLPLTVKTALFQCFLDATTSENVHRMIAMKSATDNADKMVKSLTMHYNRARQSQITTELSEIISGFNAMK